ncbi:MAG: amino acid ABC transporter permease [Clostridiales bacterium]|nr:amino acid ABC transporter permease [Clostridiales bacterium]
MNSGKTSIRNVLYEPPGPRNQKIITVVTAVSVIALAGLLAAVIRLFYINGQLDAKYWTLFTRYTTWRFIGQGLAGTLKAAAGAGVITFALGMAMMLCRISRYRIARAAGTVLVEFTRGVPTLLFIYFFFLIAPQFGITLSAYWKITLPVAISASGVVAEVLRSGVNAVPRGQSEAALSLGMRDRSVFFKIVFPQAFRYVIPAMISELVIVLKDTTFAYVVTYADLMQNAKALISNYDALLSVYLVVAVIYILINYILNRISVALSERGKQQ